MTCIIAVVLIVAAIWAWDFYRISKPLTPIELSKLALLRRKRHAYEYFNFSSRHVPLDLSFKASMRPDGAFHAVSYPVEEALGIVASHLKYKKHEWVVFMLVKDRCVVSLWCNKGPDATMVWPTIGISFITQFATSRGAHMVIRSHNHPNPHASNISLLAPSPQDLISSNLLAEEFNASRLNFIDVLCERGSWLVYGEFNAKSFFPLTEIAASLAEEIDGSKRANRSLHCELRRTLYRPGYHETSMNYIQKEAA